MTVQYEPTGYEPLIPPDDIVQKLNEVQKWLDCQKGVILMETGDGWYIDRGLRTRIWETSPQSNVSCPHVNPRNSGYVYLLHCPDNNLYKIGKSKNAPKRFGHISKQSPADIKILHYFWSEDCTNAEKILHDRNAEKRVRGEWFGLEQNEKLEIMSLHDGDL
jgi:hypothetical protein